ncbi:MAG TPA: nicotinate-nucleotide adenylyltransferase [Fimbriimonas sp.]|nr:nicotinate-nucleotide adenylyltransferase [Fimbriimonas sp.]
MRIGILGGTFDPPHFGHLKLAQAAIEALHLDEVILLPASRNPFKQHTRAVPSEHRVAMCQLLQKYEPKIAVSDMELTRGGVSYTVDTLGELQMVHPGNYWFIMGADSLKGFKDWRNPERILRLCRLAVAVRPPHDLEDVKLMVHEDYLPKIDFIPIEPTEESSTEIREKLSRRHKITGLTPPEVVDYIRRHNLYS